MAGREGGGVVKEFRIKRTAHIVIITEMSRTLKKKATLTNLETGNKI